MPQFEFHKVEHRDNMTSAARKAATLFDQKQIRPEQFTHYDPVVLAQDLAYVQKRRTEAEQYPPEEKRKAEMAKVFEAMILDCGERHHWFGDDVTMVKPSEYDDLRGGVDMVMESKPRRHHLALAIDATYATSERALDKKFNLIRHEIEQGKLAEIKYFISPNFHTRGVLEKVPRVVVGADARTVNQMAEFWLEEQEDVLKKHPIQFQILDEIGRQCDIFAQFARHLHQNAVAEQYEQARAVVNEILRTKTQTLQDPGWRDDGFTAISEELEKFRR